MPPLAWWLLAAPITAIAFALRIGVHVGREPGGVDSWYYLAFADAVRRRPSLDVRLPQYLLQDERQSYPPLFPSLLALLPAALLRRSFWLVSPILDCVHLLLLYFVAYRLTASVVVAALAACCYALTPQTVSDTRSLGSRPFGALLTSLALLLLLKATVSGGGAAFFAAAVLAGAAVFLSSAALAAAYGFVCAALTLWFADPRYLGIALAALLAAFVLSGGHYARVVRNYAYAVQYWHRNRGHFGGHPVFDSPIYGDPDRARQAKPPGFLGGTGFLSATALQQTLRLFGENPFLIALPFVHRDLAPWSARLQAWAIALSAFSVIATILPPLRAFGPGRSYMKAAIFPTAYMLASAIGSLRGLRTPVGMATLACLGFSAGAIWFFWSYVRTRATEQTATTPPDLKRAIEALRTLPAGGVFVLPYMYADCVSYNAERPVLWGGHSGDLRPWEFVTPLITRPLPDLFREYGVRYALVDRNYIDPARVGLAQTPRAAWGSFVLLEVS